MNVKVSTKQPDGDGGLAVALDTDAELVPQP
jgi:hypothetical protein